jgi:histidinol phosphatase-like enzyme
VIGDRLSDMQLAANLGAKGIWLQNDARYGSLSKPRPSNDIALANHYLGSDLYPC